MIRFYPRKIQTLDEFLKMDAIEQLILKDIKNASPKEMSDYVHRFIEAGYFRLIIKLSLACAPFSEICAAQAFKDHWTLQSKALLKTVSPQQDGHYHHESRAENQFELYSGLFFYKLAIDLKAQLKQEASQIEIKYLTKAIRFGSIHALQVMAKYRYAEIEKSIAQQACVGEEELEDLRQIIKQIKAQVPIYQCYAYVMLAEGLAASNSLDLDNFDEMKMRIDSLNPIKINQRSLCPPAGKHDLL